MMHFHGTPLSPRTVLLTMAGKCFTVPFSDPRDADTCLSIGQMVMFDNGAFSAKTKGKALDVPGYYEWLEPRLGQPHWAVIPDVIDAPAEQQREMIATWPYGRLGSPVWHMGLPIDWLIELADAWPRVCFGSSGKFWQVGSEAWCKRADEAFNALARAGHLPSLWVHMMRGLALCGDRWPFASADSVNVARNYKDSNTDPERMARRIDAVQCPVMWAVQPEQKGLFAA